MNVTKKSTLAGIAAIILWSSSIGLVRGVSENYGQLGGGFLNFSFSALFAFIFSGCKLPKKLSLAYALGGGFFYIAYSFLFVLAIGLANSSSQTLEVGLVNYLWPCFVIVFAVIILKDRPKFFLYPGLIICFIGLAWSISSDGLGSYSIISNMSSNYIPYLIAFIAAVFWGIYCSVARLYGKGQNCIPLFFLCTAVLFGISMLVSGQSISFKGFKSIFEAMGIGLVNGASFLLWERGIRTGNMNFLAAMSYFIPILSTFFSAAWLSVTPSTNFWIGATMVVIGSLLCWQATKASK